MSKNLKIFGVTCGVLSSACFLYAAMYPNNKAAVLLAMAFFTGPLLVLISLRSGEPAVGGGKKPAGGKAAKKGKPAQKAAQGKPAGKGPEKSEAKGDVTSIYVGNLSPEANETVLRTAFSGFGEIYKIKIVKDRGKPKGFAFVEMYGKDQALKAIEAMNGEELAGRPLKVSESKSKPKGNRRPKGGKPQAANGDEPIRPNIFE